uniref:helicase-related protein n=1 Tax=Paenibacillus kobensis TaxID=59841 RepID=UPI0013E3282C
GVRAPAAPDARWGLSPAQYAAASAALQYALPRLHAAARPHAPCTVPPRDAPRPRVPRTVPPPDNPRLSIPPTDTPRDAEPFLLWAVTGAGKTEMVFPLIEAAIASGGRALVATPRRDVVLELDPRIRRAFPESRVVTLYGGSEQRWEDGDIMLATTHQLFRFQEYFQLVVIDELDAFPYHGDPRLQYAAAKASVPGGAVILLTATPSKALQSAARRGKIGHVRVPVRFHRHPLPVPVYVRLPQVGKIMASRRIPSLLLSRLIASIEREAQCFVFVQQIRHAEPVAGLLRAALPGVAVGATSSKDAERGDRVQQFRDRQLRVLVTTTILERGVTVPRSDVFILDADAKLFDEASLVQMAGRAGRSKDDPAGRVYYCAPVNSRSQQLAIQQIKSMNCEAAARGYLL